MLTQRLYDFYCFPYLAYLRCFPLWPKKHYCDDMTLSWVKKNGKKSGEFLLYVYFRQFGRKEMVNHWKIKSILFKGRNTLFFVLYGIGLSCL